MQHGPTYDRTGAWADYKDDQQNDERDDQPCHSLSSPLSGILLFREKAGQKQRKRSSEHSKERQDDVQQLPVQLAGGESIPKRMK